MIRVSAAAKRAGEERPVEPHRGKKARPFYVTIVIGSVDQCAVRRNYYALRILFGIDFLFVPS
jgi:hypothetical protein